MVTGQIARQRMQLVFSRWYAQVVELSDRIELIQLRRITGHNVRGSRRAALLLTPFQMSPVARSAKVRIISCTHMCYRRSPRARNFAWSKCLSFVSGCWSIH